MLLERKCSFSERNAKYRFDNKKKNKQLLFKSLGHLTNLGLGADFAG